jgi:hypothetical protein
MNKYEIQELIGEGTYGVVMKAINKVLSEIKTKMQRSIFFSENQFN